MALSKLGFYPCFPYIYHHLHPSEFTDIGEADMALRIRVQNIGGPFPGRGSAPEMKHDKILPRVQRAGFEKLNDMAAMRPTVTDAGSLVAANDNLPTAKEDAA